MIFKIIVWSFNGWAHNLFLWAFVHCSVYLGDSALSRRYQSRPQGEWIS